MADEHIVLLKVFALLYADDTIVLAENEKELQLALDSVHEYCTLYNLTVNTSKTKIIVFSRGKVKRLIRINHILNNCGIAYMWLNQQTLHTKQCKLIIHNRLEDIAMQKWGNDMSTSSMCSGYKMFKKQLEFEKYLLNPNYGERIAMCKLRCANIKLPVYNRIFMFDTDICGLCNLCLPGDEYHNVLICPFFTTAEKYS